MAIREDFFDDSPDGLPFLGLSSGCFVQHSSSVCPDLEQTEHFLVDLSVALCLDFPLFPAFCPRFVSNAIFISPSLLPAIFLYSSKSRLIIFVDVRSCWDSSLLITTLYVSVM